VTLDAKEILEWDFTLILFENTQENIKIIRSKDENYISQNGELVFVATKDRNIKSLDLVYIQEYVENFIDWAEYHTGNIFLVTEIGCGLANFTPQQIAPMFRRAKNIENIHLPKRFWEILND
jgi:hypothetical protein